MDATHKSGARKTAARLFVESALIAGVTGRTLDDREPRADVDGFELLLQAAEQDAAAGDHPAAVRTLDDAEAWLGPLPAHAAQRREDWRRLIATTTR